MQLTQHFTLEELTASDTAARLSIDNTPPAEVVEELRASAQMLEHVRLILQVPVIVTSGYRCAALERAICETAFLTWCRRRGVAATMGEWLIYFERKAHPKGRAIDFKAPAFGTPLAVCQALAPHVEELGLDQLIHEFNSWAHAGRAAAPRHELLTIDGHGTRVGFA